MRKLMMNVLIKPMTKEQLGKIVLPSTTEDDWFRGKVLGVGPGCQGEIKVGDIVLFPPPHPSLNGGQYPTVGNEGHIIIPEPIIWAIED